MFYREAGQFKTSYASDLQAFPIRQDKIGMFIWGILALVVAVIGIPGLGYDFAMKAIIIPTLIFTITALGLNILVGFAGQISLGTGAFMGVGAYACLKLTTFFPDVNILIHFILSGFIAAGIVALVTGIMWGAKSDVSFALQIVALKALPVLVLGGFTSIPGAIVGGLIIGIGEKMFEIYWGGLMGGGVESWFAFIIALIFLLFRPQGLFGDKIIERV